MMKKMWKNRSGVSPVIATILMVAITVVLAAVLYVMVMGFGGSNAQTPTASLSKSTTGTAHQEKITIASVSEAQPYSNIKVSLVIDGASHVGNLTDGTADITWSPSIPGNTTVKYVDVGGDSKVSTGDYILVTSAGSGIDCTLSLLYGSDATSIASVDWTSN